MWSLPETITAAFVIAASLAIVYRFLGQRTDPKLLEFITLQSKTAAERDQNSDKNQERQAEAWDRNTDTLESFKAGLEKSFDVFAAAITKIVETSTSEHDQHFTAIQDIPSAIIPAIETLAQQIETQKGSVLLMKTTVGDQTGAIQQILAAVLRVESRMEAISSKFDSFQTESDQLGQEIKETQQDVVNIKKDVSKLKPIIPSKLKDIKAIKSEEKIDTNTTE